MSDQQRSLWQKNGRGIQLKRKFESATKAAPKCVGHLHYEDIYNEKETIVRKMCLHCFHLFWAPMVFHNPFVAHCSSPPSETFQLLLHCVNKHILHTKTIHVTCLWWPIPVIIALGRYKPEYQKFRVILSYIVSSRQLRIIKP